MVFHIQKSCSVSDRTAFFTSFILSQHDAVVVVLDDEPRVGVFGGDKAVDGVHVALLRCDAGGGGESAGAGLVDAGGGGPAVAHGSGQYHQRDAAGGAGRVVVIRQNVAAGQQAGVVAKAEQVAEGGHDVRRCRACPR